MSEIPPIYQLLMTILPLVISGIVAVVTSKDIQALKDALAISNTRIAVLETLLREHNIPLPAANGLMNPRPK